MLTADIDKIAHTVVVRYGQFAPGDALAFPQLVGLVFALTNLPLGTVFDICVRRFGNEYAAFDAAITRGEWAALVESRHAGRWNLPAPDPDDFAAWN